ncbi:MAG: hypothetical protein AUJ71_01890 [Candidatus Omnitrophica bacterium CG1_02_49_16]|nr:MAG: hypothetical protein AUJ71_01890 [Candidatus Omnitrophica bacterium CG1_02_49_16]
MKKPLFNKICIIGIGLMGGSIGLAIKKFKVAKFVVGVARRKQSAIDAVALKTVDMATLDIKEGVEGSDLVILAGPIPTIISQLKLIQKFIAKNALVIDVGSSKVQINQSGSRFLKNQFIGCHPMTGSEKCGVSYSEAGLFQDTICFVTKNNKKIEEFWKALGSKPIVINEADHDAWVAKSSHLSHVLSFCLFQNVDSKYPQNPSLKDLSRLAKSHAELWADIFLSNCEPLIKTSRDFQKDFSAFQKFLRIKDRIGLIRFIRRANRTASQMPKKGHISCK